MSIDPARPPVALPDDIAADAPLFLWDPLDERFLWATPEGVRFWAAEDVAALASARPAPQEPTTREMRRLWTMLDQAISPRRLETRAEFIPAGHARPVRCALRRVFRPQGAPAMLVEILGPDATASAARWRAVFQSAPAPLALFDAEGALIAENDAAIRAFAEAPGAGGSLDQRFVDAADARRALQLALAHGAYSQPARLQLRDGARVGHLRLSRVSAPEDGAPAILALTLSPGADAASELALDARALVAEAAVGLGVVERRNGGAALTLANARLAELLHLPAFQATREIDLGAPATRQIAALIEELSREDAPTSATLDVIPPIVATAKGDARVPGPWLRVTASAIGADRFALTAEDLGPERRALLRLKIAQEQNAAALEALGVGLAVISADGKIQNISAAGAGLLGRPEEAILGAPLDSLLSRADARRLQDYLSRGPVVAGRAFETGVDAEFQAAAAEGEGEAAEPIPARLAIAPRSRLSPGRRRVAFHRLPAVEAKAPTGSQEQEPSPRAAELAHALRTRLTSVIGFAELLLEETDAAAGPLADAYLADIVAAAEESVTLVDRMLMPRAEPADAPRAAPGRPASLIPILRSVAARRDDLFGRKDAARTRISGAAGGDAPPEVDPWIAAKPFQLREALERLLSAVEAEAESGPTRVSLEPVEADQIRVSATAPGAPIPEDDLSLRLLQGVLETIGATMQTDETERRVSILFRTIE